MTSPVMSFSQIVPTPPLHAEAPAPAERGGGDGGSPRRLKAPLAAALELAEDGSEGVETPGSAPFDPPDAAVAVEGVVGAAVLPWSLFWLWIVW